MYDIRNIAIILIDLVGISLAFWVYFGNPKEKTNQGFFLMVISILSWITFYHFASLPTYRNLSLLSFRIATGSVFAFFIAYYFFIIRWFLKQKGLYEFLGKLVFVYGLTFGLISIFTNSIIISLKFDDWAVIPIFPLWGWIIFYGHVFLLTILINIVLIKNYATSSQEKKSKIRFFLTGLIIFAILNIIFNVILPVFFGNYKLYFLGNYSTIFLIGFTAYAITKHQLFNIKVIATETTVIFLSIGLLVEVLLSNDLTEGLLKSIVWVLATYGGYALVKSVKREIEQKEDLERLAKKLDEANQHLEELDETKDNFLSMASHELNTPIAAIEGYLSMIIDEKMAGELNPKAKEYLTNVYNSSKRLAALVKDLLNVSRIESNRVHIIYTEMQIEDVIDQAFAEIKMKAKEAGHTLTFEKPKNKLPKTFLDVPRIIEVMINLIGNAIKYTAAPGKIVVKCHADDNKIVVSVEDNGRGIPKDKYEHMFEKFTQVDVLKDEVKGTGLGMFISKNLIELHKGKLWFKSSVDEKDHGTTFYFSIPILKKKPFDPNEGEGALFQTSKKATTNEMNQTPEAGKSQEDKPKDAVENKPESDDKTATPIPTKDSLSTTPAETAADSKARANHN